MSVIRRNTIQKQLVMNTVRTLRTHPTAEDVYTSIVRSYPGISKATVYRNLNHLADEGQLLKISVPGAADKYDAEMNIHHHAVCRICGGFMDVTLDKPIMIDLSDPVMKENGISGYTILFNGICEQCRSTEK